MSKKDYLHREETEYILIVRDNIANIGIIVEDNHNIDRKSLREII